MTPLCHLDTSSTNHLVTCARRHTAEQQKLKQKRYRSLKFRIIYLNIYTMWIGNTKTEVQISYFLEIAVTIQKTSTHIQTLSSIHCQVDMSENFDVLLTVHLSIFISVINQLYAQNFCFTISFISCLYMFRAPCAHHQEVKIALHSLWYHHTYRCNKLVNYWDKCLKMYPNESCEVFFCPLDAEIWHILIIFMLSINHLDT